MKRERASHSAGVRQSAPSAAGLRRVPLRIRGVTLRRRKPGARRVNTWLDIRERLDTLFWLDEGE